MSSAPVKARDLSDTSVTKMVAAKFPPRSVNDRSPTHETKSPLTQVFEVGVARIDADSEVDDVNPARTNLDDGRLLNARQVAEKLGVSERFIRDHTTRRSPRIPAVKLGKLLRYRRADVDVFMAELGTLPASNRSRIRV